MPTSPLADVFSHWYKPFDNFHTGSMPFYSAVESALESRKVPGLAYSRIHRKETGVFSAKRTYLRVSREDLMFDVCAAPFGTGFFFSWWLVEKRGRPFLYALVVLVLFVPLIRTDAYHTVRRIVDGFLFEYVPFLDDLPGFLWRHFHLLFDGLVLFLLFALPARLGVPRAEQSVLGIPIVGRLYEWLFRPRTYYRIDTTLMFQSLVHGAVVEVIDGLTTIKGLRALTDDEKKPIMRDFLARR